MHIAKNSVWCCLLKKLGFAETGVNFWRAQSHNTGVSTGHACSICWDETLRKITTVATNSVKYNFCLCTQQFLLHVLASVRRLMQWALYSWNCFLCDTCSAKVMVMHGNESVVALSTVGPLTLKSDSSLNAFSNVWDSFVPAPNGLLKSLCTSLMLPSSNLIWLHLINGSICSL